MPEILNSVYETIELEELVHPGMTHEDREDTISRTIPQMVVA